MRKANKRILIIPEGFCEYSYAQSVKASLPRNKQRGITVDIPKPDGNNTALQLLERANSMAEKAKRDRNEYDSIWIFFDNDSQPFLEEFFQNAVKHNVDFAYSSICIEHWFILHLIDKRTMYQNSKQALTDIKQLWKRHFKQEYHKTKIKHYDVLKNHLPDAINRSRLIEAQAAEDNQALHKRNPYFTIQHLIKFLESL